MSKIKDSITPNNWCKGHYAEDGNGKAVFPNSERATRRCLDGWLSYCYHDTEIWFLVREKLRQVVPFGAITAFNDDPTTTFEDIKALVDQLDI